MTFRKETPEISLLKYLRYNHYIDISSFQGVTGLIDSTRFTVQPFVEAFLTTKERFNFEIEVMTVQRGEDGKPSDLVPTKQVIQVTGLGLPNPGNGVQNDVTTKTLKFIDFKVNAIGSYGNYYDLYYGEYWSDDITSIASNPAIIPSERTVTVDINKIGLSNTLENGADSFGQNQTGNPNTFWTNTLPGQVLDIACYLP